MQFHKLLLILFGNDKLISTVSLRFTLMEIFNGVMSMQKLYMIW